MLFQDFRGNDRDRAVTLRMHGCKEEEQVIEVDVGETERPRCLWLGMWISQSPK